MGFFEGGLSAALEQTIPSPGVSSTSRSMMLPSMAAQNVLDLVEAEPRPGRPHLHLGN
jgi:hypothetical protein